MKQEEAYGNYLNSILTTATLRDLANQSICETTTAVKRKTRLGAIIIGRRQGADTFFAFQPMGIFRVQNP